MKKLSDFGYVLDYAENVRKAALIEAVKELEYTRVVQRLRSRKNEIVQKDLEWLKTYQQQGQEEDDSIAQSLKKRAPRQSAVKAKRSIAFELESDPNCCEDFSNDETYESESSEEEDSEDEDDNDFMDVELLDETKG